MRRLKIRHVTEYAFSVPVTLLPHRLLLRPREDHAVRIASSVLDITPLAKLRWQRDALDNSIAVATFSAPTQRLRILSEIAVEHYDEAPLDFLVADYAVRFPFAYEREDAQDLAPFLGPTWPNDRSAVDSWLGPSRASAETFALLDALNRRIPREFQYEARDEPGVQSPRLTLSRARGSCRDLAALFLEACRCLGFAARFVSGYHTTHAGETGLGSTHAWVEVYLPGPGWKGFDPTGGVVTGSEHIAVAVSHHPERLPPVSGSFLGPASPTPSMHVEVHVLAI